MGVQNGVEKNEPISDWRYFIKSVGNREIPPDTNRLVFQKSKNHTKPSQMIENHVQSLKQYDIRCSGGVGVIRSSKIGQKRTYKMMKSI